MSMLTKERLKREIDKVQEGYLDVLFRIIQAFEYGPSPSPHDTVHVSSEPQENTMQEWLAFIDKTYGSLAADPIERGEQGDYEIREAIL